MTPMIFPEDMGAINIELLFSIKVISNTDDFVELIRLIMLAFLK